jgi:hypothetical protein
LLATTAQLFSFTFRLFDNHAILATETGTEFEYFALGNATALGIDMITRSRKESKDLFHMSSTMHGQTITFFKKLFEPASTSLAIEFIDET